MTSSIKAAHQLQAGDVVFGELVFQIHETETTPHGRNLEITTTRGTWHIPANQTLDVD